MIADPEILAAAVRVRSTIGEKGCPWECKAYLRTDGRAPMMKYLNDCDLLARQFLHEHATDLPEE